MSSAAAYDLILRDVTVPGWPMPCDIAMVGERIAEVAPRLEGRGRGEWSGAQRWVLPALVEPHLHLDKAFSLDLTGPAADLAGAVTATAALRQVRDRPGLMTRGRRLLDTVQAWGVGALRAHVNVDPAVGLLGVEAALALREEYGDRLRVQVVAFASRHGLPERPTRELLVEAARLGCDSLGASIGIDDDPGPVLKVLFELAEARGLGVDLHVDEHTEPRCPGLAALIPATLAHGYAGRVVAGHCSALACVDATERASLIEGLATARITVAVLPLTNLFLQGRGDPSGPRGIAPVRELLAAGVQVVCGSDNVQDAFLPYGNGDPLLAAFVLGIAAQLTTEAERAALTTMVTTAAAEVLALGDYGVRPGGRADLVVLDCRPPDGPVVSLPRRALVVRGGRVAPLSVADGGVEEAPVWTTPSM
ncbi:MAG: amidohydrolase family protein [Armatimonadota bacterium]|nr:amidohydrolase family protein [Armatimonadota bacterium]MDR7448285.1 amidohydrolase family protein [Armatimonadota bacterium]MDR7458315.1 amidohydrolase family protein [Armatimonadota bacterium]MDR7478382.1 amidohydrolase family protein [Armatimonadota bacterium]MDR7487316.1 amidohydrolase family protein [Armatimonadota bacterium]